MQNTENHHLPSRQRVPPGANWVYLLCFCTSNDISLFLSPLKLVSPHIHLHYRLIGGEGGLIFPSGIAILTLWGEDTLQSIHMVAGCCVNTPLS